jgi:hypothetical protein
MSARSPSLSRLSVAQLEQLIAREGIPVRRIGPRPSSGAFGRADLVISITRHHQEQRAAIAALLRGVGGR